MSQNVVGRGDITDCSFAVKTIRDNSELSVKKLCNFIKNETNSLFFTHSVNNGWGRGVRGI